MKLLKIQRPGLSLEKRRNLHGYVFILPWFIGAVAFFCVPLISAVRYVFNSVQVLPGGAVYTFVGLENLRDVFLRDPDNVRLIAESIGSTLGESLLIVALSLFLAILLHRQFPTVKFAKAIYALPVIVSSGVLLSIFKNDLFAQSMISGSDATIFQSTQLSEALLSAGLPHSLVESVTQMTNRIMDVVWRSGVQIILFTAALNSISPQLYEVCRVEGASPWQIFWNVTFPMVTPYILLNAIYSVIDTFTYYSNPIMTKLRTLFSNNLREDSTTLSLVYCLCVLAVVGLIFLFLSKKVTYIEK